MSMLLALLAAAAFAPPAGPLADQLEAAIWYDLERSAVIGEDASAAALWYRAADEERLQPHIQDFRCLDQSPGKLCAFTLFREGGETTVGGKKAPDKLTCRAVLLRGQDGWVVKQLPPREAERSKTTLECE